MYPALVNCTTIDLFNEWPQEALLEVGERYLANVNLEGNEQVNSISIVVKIIQFIQLVTLMLNFNFIYINLCIHLILK